jgi:pyruvate-formate lyase
MRTRFKELTKGVDVVRSGRIPVGVQKARLITESFQATEGQPAILRMARALHEVASRMDIFIEDHQLLAGNPASKPWGVELTQLWGVWPESEIAALEAAGFQFEAGAREEIARLNEYWRDRCLTARMTQLYDDDRLWPYAQLGIVLPAFRSREEGWGAGGMLGGGYGIQHEISQFIGTPDYALVLERGTRALIAEAREALARTRLFSAEAVEQADYLRAVIISLRALELTGTRFSALAAEMAGREGDQERRRELLLMADTCARVPAEPARTFNDAIQCYWFLMLCMLPSGVLGMGRLDQLLYPYYERDKAAGLICAEQAVELLGCLRIRDMGVTVTGGMSHRAKWAGGSKWHNVVIGGQDESGRDATNELSFLILDAALAVPTPHHTITLRVHEGTPDDLLRRALEVARTGLGMPALVGDKGMIDYLVSQGVAVPEARDYNIAGCLSVSLTGQSRVVACPMFVTPRVLEIALRGGHDPHSGTQAGPLTTPLPECATFDDFYRGLCAQLGHFLELQAEFNNVTIRAIAEKFPRPLESALMVDGLRASRSHLDRTLPYENANMVNPIGLINVADSLTAIEQLVFAEGKVSGAELLAALETNWQGERGEEIRQLCLRAPKFGNDDERADAMTARLFTTVAALSSGFGTTCGGTTKASALTIGTSAWPGGALTGATPDGRRAGQQPLAEESLTPSSGSEQRGASQVLASAASIPQIPFQSTELDIRFAAGALDREPDLAALAVLIRQYFARGGKHLQLNVADRAVLAAAREKPELYPDLMVRLGGSSSYFVQLSPELQVDIIARSQLAEVS